MITKLEEEIANALTHGLGLVFGIFAYCFLSIFCIQCCPWDEIVANHIYGLSLISIYAGSTFYHALGDCLLKSKLRIMDHVLIYFYIAGTYTPVLVKMKTTIGFLLLTTVWIIAILGMLHKWFF